MEKTAQTPNGQRQSVTARWTGWLSQEREKKTQNHRHFFFQNKGISVKLRAPFKTYCFPHLVYSTTDTPAVPFKSVNPHPFAPKICTFGIFYRFRLICFSPKNATKAVWTTAWWDLCHHYASKALPALFVSNHCLCSNVTFIYYMTLIQL